MLSLRADIVKSVSHSVFSRLYRASLWCCITPLNKSHHWTCGASIASRSARGFFVIVTLNIIVNIFCRRIFFVKYLIVSVLWFSGFRNIKMQLSLLGVMDHWVG